MDDGAVHQHRDFGVCKTYKIVLQYGLQADLRQCSTRFSTWPVADRIAAPFRLTAASPRADPSPRREFAIADVGCVCVNVHFRNADQERNVLALFITTHHSIDLDLNQPFRIHKPCDSHDRIDWAGFNAVLFPRLYGLFPGVDIRQHNPCPNDILNSRASLFKGSFDDFKALSGLHKYIPNTHRLALRINRSGSTH